MRLCLTTIADAVVVAVANDSVITSLTCVMVITVLTIIMIAVLLLLVIIIASFSLLLQQTPESDSSLDSHPGLCSHT